MNKTKIKLSGSQLMVPFILVLIILALFITITPGAFDEKMVLFLALLIAASWLNNQIEHLQDNFI
ncbi:MAG: hypothetical protein LUG84_08545 [Akkermansiaceae bacterium]|nr:hypothetical protein [Akkermansiaceae bacterium]